MSDDSIQKKKDTTPELFVHWFNFTNWLFDRTARFPKNIRHTLTNRIEDLTLEILVNIVKARYDRENRKSILSMINLDLEKMRVLLRLCHSRCYLSNSQFEHAVREVDKAGQMTGGWLKHGRQPE